jgi:hypothetical protein
MNENETCRKLVEKLIRYRDNKTAKSSSKQPNESSVYEKTHNKTSERESPKWLGSLGSDDKKSLSNLKIEFQSSRSLLKNQRCQISLKKGEEMNSTSLFQNPKQSRPIGRNVKKGKSNTSKLEK